MLVGVGLMSPTIRLNVAHVAYSSSAICCHPGHLLKVKVMFVCVYVFIPFDELSLPGAFSDCHQSFLTEYV